VSNSQRYDFVMLRLSQVSCPSEAIVNHPAKGCASAAPQQAGNSKTCKQHTASQCSQAVDTNSCWLQPCSRDPASLGSPQGCADVAQRLHLKQCSVRRRIACTGSGQLAHRLAAGGQRDVRRGLQGLRTQQGTTSTSCAAGSYKVPGQDLTGMLMSLAWQVSSLLRSFPIVLLPGFLLWCAGER
jgi:hypothetical protein